MSVEVSATPPHSLYNLLLDVIHQVPLPEGGPQGSGGRLPLVKTRSAQTPYGTEVVRELNIDDAVAASQGGTATYR